MFALFRNIAGAKRSSPCSTYCQNQAQSEVTMSSYCLILFSTTLRYSSSQFSDYCWPMIDFEYSIPRLILKSYSLQHVALLQSCLNTIAPHPSSTTSIGANRESVPAPVVLVFYSHHVPQYADRDLRFFVEAKERGWVCEEMDVEKYPVSEPFATPS